MSARTFKNWLDVLTDSPGVSDPRTSRFLMKSPLELITILVVYLVVVFRVGPQFMRNRKPFSLKGTILAYNLTQIVANGILCYLSFDTIVKINQLCTPPETYRSKDAGLKLDLHYYFVLLKYLDLVETAFFILRKKDRQISFLHIYHHFGTLLTAWIPGKYFPGGQLLFVGFFNTLAHFIMYSYYSVSMFNSGAVWWKKYVTALQIIQQLFILLSVLPTVFVTSCSYPVPFMGVFALNVVVILYLFGQFYVTTYLRKTK